jgi:hypothetical protein
MRPTSSDAVRRPTSCFSAGGRIGTQGVESHLETDYLAYGPTEEAARAAIGAMALSAVKQLLDDLIREHSANQPSRKWWDAMRDE